MARYIDADVEVSEYVTVWECECSEFGKQTVMAVDDLHYLPAADVAPRSEWITVENPPEEYRDEYGELIPFLVCCEGTVYPFRAVYDGANWGDGISILNVTHWMSLPEPPVMKGEQNDTN